VTPAVYSTTLGIEKVHGFLLDLGLSSDQLQWAARGFSFAADGPLDMRYDPDSDVTAADLVNNLPADKLADIFFSSERNAIAAGSRGGSSRRGESFRSPRPPGSPRSSARVSLASGERSTPATRTFQALRIKVNEEFDHLEDILADVSDLLEPGGRIAAISFHSLEDRRVKHAFRDDPVLTVLTKKPVAASDSELAANPRARSAN